MGRAPHYIFPGAIFGSIVLGILALSLTAGTALPSNLSSPSPGLQQNNPQVAQAEESLTSDSDGSGCEVSLKYPQQIRQWCQLITSYSHANGLDPNLVAALVWQESGGDSLAYSKSGAVGLMQVMPRDGIASTFMCINGPCFTNRPTIQELQDPNFNVEFGTSMLGGLQVKYGEMREALKYYGPMDVGYTYADKVLGIYSSYRD